jgi:glycosyltransferase involved in cell wall biosynthesis
VERLIREINPQPTRIELIPNGIDVAAVSAAATRPADFQLSRPFVLCLGNLGPMKGFDDAVAAYALARDQLDDLAMVIVGSGELEASLRREVTAAGLEHDVLFAGKRTGNDKRWFLRNCRFGLMPSIEEGHPIVGLEFLAVGKPVVCSTNAAFDGMYDGGVNSLRVPARDREALAGAIAAMSHGDLTDMGAESRRRADHYTWPAIADRYLAFMERVLSEIGSSPRQ